MVILILSILAALLVVGYLVLVHEWHYGVSAGIFGGLLTLAGIAGVGFGASAIVTFVSNDHVIVMSETTTLHALDTGSDDKGSFFLLTGHSSSGPSYTYLTEREDGGFEMKSVATSSAIVYQGSEEAHVITGKVRPKSMTWSILPVTAKVRFYVPEGSVQEPEYRVDVNR